jgi:hypothetical protein
MTCTIQIQESVASYDTVFEAPADTGNLWSANALLDAVDYEGDKPLVFL